MFGAHKPTNGLRPVNTLKRPAPAPEPPTHGSMGKRRASWYVTSEMVTIVVGPERKRFYLNNDILCVASGFFDKCLNGKFEEAGTKEVALSEDQPDAFHVIVDYLHNPAFKTTVPLSLPASFEDLVHAWVLADKLMMAEAKDAIMDLIRYTIVQQPSNGESLVELGLNTLQQLETCPNSQSAIYRFFVVRFAHDMVKSCSNTCTHEGAHTTATDRIFSIGGPLIVDVMQHFRARMRLFPGSTDDPDPAKFKNCAFHDHADGLTGASCDKVNAPVVPTTTKLASSPASTKLPREMSPDDIFGANTIRGRGQSFRGLSRGRGGRASGVRGM